MPTGSRPMTRRPTWRLYALTAAALDLGIATASAGRWPLFWLTAAAVAACALRSGPYFTERRTERRRGYDGLVIEQVGRYRRYHDPELRRHLQARRARREEPTCDIED
jgi:hypothetical protein